jgi:hypothetical protein
MAIHEYEDEGHARPRVVPTEHALRRDLCRMATLNRTLSDPARLARLGPAPAARLRAQVKSLEVRIASLRRGRALQRIRAV